MLLACCHCIWFSNGADPPWHLLATCGAALCLKRLAQNPFISFITLCASILCSRQCKSSSRASITRNCKRLAYIAIITQGHFIHKRTLTRVTHIYCLDAIHNIIFGPSTNAFPSACLFILHPTLCFSNVQSRGSAKHKVSFHHWHSMVSLIGVSWHCQHVYGICPLLHVTSACSWFVFSIPHLVAGKVLSPELGQDCLKPSLVWVL